MGAEHHGLHGDFNHRRNQSSRYAVPGDVGHKDPHAFLIDRDEVVKIAGDRRHRTIRGTHATTTIRTRSRPVARRLLWAMNLSFDPVKTNTRMPATAIVAPREVATPMRNRNLPRLNSKKESEPAT